MKNNSFGLGGRPIIRLLGGGSYFFGLLLTVMLALPLAGCGKGKEASQPQRASNQYYEKDAETGRELGVNSTIEIEIAELTNQERAKEGLPPLVMVSYLTAAAQKHSINMARQGKMAHELDGKNPADRVTATGYKWSSVGENVAMGQESAEEVVTAWMNSPGHRKNIMHKTFTQIGVGVQSDKDGRLFFCQNFGKPRGDFK